MKCPVCAVDLQMTDRQGIEIDYCPKCRGVWLDRGELDKLIERSTAQEPGWDQGSSSQAPRSDERRGDYREGDYGRGDYGRGDYSKHRRKKSFWREMFDFD